ncbi:MAG: DUF6282 family protein, partial [Dehalococcoidia bacterium]|nr:DUF6282 family protein [Dehalococcoidia bacterium]
APIVWAVSQFVKDVGLYGSIVLNSAVGGLNPEAVEVAARLGAKIVWMPTQTAKNDIRGSGSRGVGVFDENGSLVTEVYEILDIVRKFDIAVATGHLGHQASFAVIDAAREKGIKKIVYTHAMLGLVGTPLTIEQQRDAVRRGALIEYCAFSIMPTGEGIRPSVFAAAIKEVGAANCIISTDMGQTFSPSAPEGMRLMIAAMLRAKVSESDVELMVRTNPRQLLGL